MECFLVCRNVRESKRIGRLYLPEEVVEEILLRLPPEALKTCKQVRKFWYNFINNRINKQSFINKHLRFTIEHSQVSSSVSLFLMWTRLEESWESKVGLSEKVLALVTISKDDANSSSAGDHHHLPCVIEQLSLPPIPEMEQVHFPKALFGTHCDGGVICFFDSRKTSNVVLCNPALGKFKILHIPGLTHGMMQTMAHGFGYDHKANVYKYVHILRVGLSLRILRAQVYTLGTDSWRDVEMNIIAERCHSLDWNGVYCKGVYYWLNRDGETKRIVSFDMSEEKFHAIPLPNETRICPYCLLTRLVVWNESVVFFFRPPSFLEPLEMWVMIHNSAAGSTYWRKHLKTGPLLPIQLPLGFWKDDELLAETTEALIVSYNIYTRKIRKLPIPKVSVGYSYASLCLRSLVSF